MAHADDTEHWRLPFCIHRADHVHGLLRCSCLPPVGSCCQASDGSTHTDELRFAYDFLLPVGTPVLASRAGEVAAAVDCFGAGGRSAEYRAKANYVALRHAPGLYTRYYHLARASVCVRVGQHVQAGELIGRSGNTGFSTAPHLHFDVCDVIPVETSSFAPVGGEPLACCAAAFSAELPSVDAPLRAPVVWAEPPTAATALTNSARTRGAIVLLERCPDVDFLDKARQGIARRRVEGIAHPPPHCVDPTRRSCRCAAPRRRRPRRPWWSTTRRAGCCTPWQCPSDTGSLGARKDSRRNEKFSI